MEREVENELNDDESRRLTRARIERSRRALKAAEPPGVQPPDILRNPHARAFHERLMK